MLTPEYLYRITEGAENIASQLHKYTGQDYSPHDGENRTGRRLSSDRYGQMAD